MVISDITGAYDVTTNPTGWGTPNASHTDIVLASLEVTTPTGVVFTSDPALLLATITGATTDPFELDVFLPTGTTFVDGIYHIVYTVSTSTDSYLTTIDIAMDCLVSCCVDKMFAELPNKMCDSCNYMEFLENALQAEALLKAFRCASSCGDSVKANAILASLQTICNWADCQCN
jgi:hypothetical protein